MKQLVSVFSPTEIYRSLSGRFKFLTGYFADDHLSLPEPLSPPEAVYLIIPCKNRHFGGTLAYIQTNTLTKYKPDFFLIFSFEILYLISSI